LLAGLNSTHPTTRGVLVSGTPKEVSEEMRVVFSSLLETVPIGRFAAIHELPGGMREVHFWEKTRKERGGKSLGGDGGIGDAGS
jgi:hypothetical protein